MFNCMLEVYLLKLSLAHYLPDLLTNVLFLVGLSLISQRISVKRAQTSKHS